MGRTQKVRMLKRTPRGPEENNILHTYTVICEMVAKRILVKTNTIFSSKSVYDSEEKNNLSVCNMAAHKARKAICERVQVGATLRDRNL